MRIFFTKEVHEANLIKKRKASRNYREAFLFCYNRLRVIIF